MDFKTLLEQSGKTRSQIITEVGCSQPYLSLLENGERRIGPRLLTKMAKALGVEPKDIRPDLAAHFSSADPKHGNASAQNQGADTE